MDIKLTKHPRIFEIFEEISAIPHGSENCSELSGYCVDFAKRHGLEYHRDNADNVVIYKEATNGEKSGDPIILQGHLDMVCQKEIDSNIDFLKDGLKLKSCEDYIFADGTTLGADNGIAVAMILYILESNGIKHPPIEAVFTTDEEIGMIGAGKLDVSLLKGKRMVNLDAEEDNTVTVSCAGGSDFFARLPINFINSNGSLVTVELKGLKGGHSGVEINSGRINSNILAGRILSHLSKNYNYDIVGIYGGDKGNAITNYTKIVLVSNDPIGIDDSIKSYIQEIQNEICSIEPGFYAVVSVDPELRKYSVMDKNSKDDLIFILNCIPNGVQSMSGEIKDLVETSLNLGILKTDDSCLSMLVSLRSNKESSLIALTEKLKIFFSKTKSEVNVSGFYPPWEYKKDSSLRTQYIDAYKSITGKDPQVAAIHAGLECAIFASKINDIDCIAIGPNIYDVHTVGEKLSISSTEQTFEVLVELLKRI